MIPTRVPAEASEEGNTEGLKQQSDNIWASEEFYKMSALVSEGEGSSSTAEVSSTTCNDTDVELPEYLNSPDSRKFFQYIGRLMAGNEEHPNELDVMNTIAFKGSADYIDKIYQVDEDNVSNNAGDGGRVQATGKEAVDTPRESARRRRFFGVYERVKVKSIWEKLMKLGLVRRSKRLRLMDISVTTSIELNYGQEA